jgi:hypothetical protein
MSERRSNRTRKATVIFEALEEGPIKKRRRVVTKKSAQSPLKPIPINPDPIKPKTDFRQLLKEWWRPMWYFLLSTVINNAFLIWIRENGTPHGHDHLRFQEDLISHLMQTPLVPDPQPYGPWPAGHVPTPCKARVCVYEQEQGDSGVQDKTRKRAFGTEIVNGVLPPKNKTYAVYECLQCGGKALCTRKDCWHKYHAQIRHQDT